MPSILHGFAESVQRYPGRPALYLEGQSFSYEALAHKAATIAAGIAAAAPTDNPLAGVFATRGLTAYSGILGILASGRGYVPVHPHFPEERLLDIVERSGIDVLITGPEALDRLELVLNRIERPLAVLAPEVEDLSLWASHHRQHRFLSARDLKKSTDFTLPPVTDDSTAYLLFTSGSTGRPKGVAVSHRNSSAYVDYICHAYQIGPQDRASQTFKLAFDLSVHDLFTTWSRGACLYPLSRSARMAPGRFIREHDLTLWFSVPTLGITMDRFRQLAPGAFPSLRASLFCGEPFPASLAQKWSLAAPNSTVDNLYGPTEATIAFTAYRWRGENSLPLCRHGVVPLGRAFPDQKALVVRDDGSPAAAGERGELLLSGSQVTAGYWRAPHLTAERYVRLPHSADRIWYRTGDVVERDNEGCLHFLGRTDHQIQIGGHRIELAEVDHALRKACGHEFAISVASPENAEAMRRIVGFVASDEPIDENAILEACRRQIPDYMVPERVIGLARLPVNSSGKIDRKALQQMLVRSEVGS